MFLGWAHTVWGHEKESEEMKREGTEERRIGKWGDSKIKKK
jgi:hypothetical protein